MNKEFMSWNKGFNSRGQFFSPDVLIASAIFIFALMIFFSASNSIFFQQSLLESQKKIDETAHNVLNTLILSPGQPSNWENGNISDANSIGLALSNNVLSPGKTVALLNALSNPNNYTVLKHKLGLGKYDLYVRLLTPTGAVVSYNGLLVAGGVVASNPVTKLSYKRFVLFGGSSAVIETVFSAGN